MPTVAWGSIAAIALSICSCSSEERVGAGRLESEKDCRLSEEEILSRAVGVPLKSSNISMKSLSSGASEDSISDVSLAECLLEASFSDCCEHETQLLSAKRVITPATMRARIAMRVERRSSIVSAVLIAASSENERGSEVWSVCLPNGEAWRGPCFVCFPALVVWLVCFGCLLLEFMNGRLSQIQRKRRQV